jgi:Rab9 effector protein with kelch motifs
MDRQRATFQAAMPVEWKKVEPQGKERPGPLSHHTSVLYGDRMYLFGGSGPRSKALTDVAPPALWSLDLKTLRWEVVSSRGEVPITRDDHTAVLYEGNSMFVFGGFVEGERTNEVIRYYFKENRWEEVDASEEIQPKPRAGHSAVVHGDHMAIFGGRDEDNEKLNDLWLLNLQTYIWTHVIDAIDMPIPRSGHSACIYKDSMVIFGGIFEVTKELNDLLLFDFA